MQFAKLYETSKYQRRIKCRTKYSNYNNNGYKKKSKKKSKRENNDKYQNIKSKQKYINNGVDLNTEEIYDILINNEYDYNDYDYSDFDDDIVNNIASHGIEEMINNEYIQPITSLFCMTCDMRKLLVLIEFDSKIIIPKDIEDIIVLYIGNQRYWNTKIINDKPIKFQYKYLPKDDSLEPHDDSDDSDDYYKCDNCDDGYYDWPHDWDCDCGDCGWMESEFNNYIRLIRDEVDRCNHDVASEMMYNEYDEWQDNLKEYLHNVVNFDKVGCVEKEIIINAFEMNTNEIYENGMYAKSKYSRKLKHKSKRIYGKKKKKKYNGKDNDKYQNIRSKQKSLLDVDVNIKEIYDIFISQKL